MKEYISEMNNHTYNAFHLRFGDRNLIPELKRLMRKVLAPAGVDMLILEIDKSFVFQSHPEIDSGKNALTVDDAADLSAFSRNLGIEIVPLMQCLGHQGWGGSRSALLTAHPEFDETPNTPLNAEWPEIFCRSWCPQHPDINEIVFDLMDELIDGFSANYFHIGMDEVYEIASDQCERCKNGNRAELFAKSVNDMYSHLSKERGATVMMWGDRLIDAELFGYDNWEGDTFGTFHAIDHIPKDIVLLDWHYDEREKGFPTPRYFMEHGFSVMPACWFKQDVAVELFSEAEEAAKDLRASNQIFGRLVTSWHSWNEEAFDRFIAFTMKEGQVGEEQWRLYNTLQKVASME
ncbi:family 20 glycosylhydrolase [Desemzia sp. RIT 804]|uniref:family 20 glycosylhydrolase n=1 Tax=Desemzia sp. RIT 804 TaxID=2810209 RepID=UPI0021041CAA|nr:family 20 glycosylhydrolase [Desemzia sp. RIT 804]